MIHNFPVLLVVDVQQGMVEGPDEWGARSTPTLTENIALLLSMWRERKWPIVHVQHNDTEDQDSPISSLHPETYAIHDSAAPEGGEPVFVKTTGSAFGATRLLSLFQDKYKERRIVIAGMDGAQCINSSTRHGTDLGFEMLVVGDACASYGMKHWQTGENIAATTAHDSAMTMLAGYAVVTTTDRVIDVLGF